MWTEVTPLFRSAAGDLDHPDYIACPMINTENFNLHEAMSAMELFDEKMDPCANIKGLTIETEILNPQISLTIEQIILIMEKLWVYEMAYLDGASILESTHQCIYLWKESWETLLEQNTLESRILLAFCKLLLKSMAYIHRSIMDSDVHSDEDYQSVTRPVLILEESDEDVVLFGEGVLHELNTLLADDNNSISVEKKQILTKVQSYLSLRCSLFQFYQKYGELNNFALRHFPVHSFKNESDFDAEFSACKVLIASILQQISTTSALFPSSPPTPSTLSINSEISSILSEENAVVLDRVFSLNLVRMTQLSALRFIPFASLQETFTKHFSIITQIAHICTILYECYSSLNTLTFEYLLHLTVDISSRHYHLLPRSLLVAMLYPLRPTLPSLLLLSMHKRGLPTAAISSPYTISWVESSLVHPAWDILKAFCEHRHVVLIKLEQILPKWGRITLEANHVDMTFRNDNKIPDESFQGFVFWIMLIVSLLMDATMGTMIESGLIANHELGYFFWYWDYICTTRITALKHLREFQMNLEKEIYETAKQIDALTLTIDESAKKRAVGGKKKDVGGKKKDVGGKKAAVVPPPKLPPPSMVITASPEEFFVAGQGQVCRGIFRMSVVAQELGYISSVNVEYTSDEMRFLQRFRVFQEICSPPPLAYSDYRKMLDTTIVVSELLNSATHCFKNAKIVLDEAKKTPCTRPHEALIVDTIQSLLKVCVANNISNMRIGLAEKELRQQSNSDTRKHLSVERNYHPLFPVIELK